MGALKFPRVAHCLAAARLPAAPNFKCESACTADVVEKETRAPLFFRGTYCPGAFWHRSLEMISQPLNSSKEKYKIAAAQNENKCRVALTERVICFAA